MFSSVVDESWSFNKIIPVEKMHKWGENGFSGSHKFQLKDQIEA
jgi:hypothetical protein